MLGTSTSRFNRRHKLFGHLFSGRYKSLIVDGSGSGYLKRVCDYVHLNPARAKLVAVDVHLKNFVWSSWSAYLLAPAKRPAWLRVDRLLSEWGIPKDSPAGRQRLEQSLEARRGAAEGDEFKPIRRGWCLGEGKFSQELLAQMSAQLGAEHYGAFAGGDDAGGGVDRGAVGAGHAWPSQPPAVSPPEVRRRVIIIKNPFTSFGLIPASTPTLLQIRNAFTEWCHSSEQRRGFLRVLDIIKITAQL